MSNNNQSVSSRYWFISVVFFILTIILLSNFWFYHEFYSHQKAMLNKATNAVVAEFDYKLLQIEIGLLHIDKNLDNKKSQDITNEEIINLLKLSPYIGPYIGKEISDIEIFDKLKDHYNKKFEARTLIASHHNLYLVVSDELQKNKLVKIYFDINKFLQIFLQKFFNINRQLFELNFIFKNVENIDNKNISYIIRNDSGKIDKLDDVMLYNNLPNNQLKLIKRQFILGDPNWQVHAYLKQSAIQDFIKKLIFISTVILFILLCIANWYYKKFYNLEDDKNLAERKINYLAYHDGLTGLPNKVSLIRDYDEILSQYELFYSNNYKLFTIAINTPMLSNINDTIGYQYGDESILCIVNIINNYLIISGFTNNKIFYRISGNTFILSILYNRSVHGKSAILFITNFLNSLIIELSKPIDINEEDLYFHYHLGVSIYPDDFFDKYASSQSVTSEKIFRCAEIAMSAAKKKGADKYIFYSEEMNTNILKRFNLENELRRALVSNKLEVLLQPQVNLVNKKLRGFEVLIRWQREDGSIVSPGTFIPILEESGLIITVGDWILLEACTKGVALLNNKIIFDTLSVNISVLQLQSEGFIERLDSIITQSGFSYDKLEVEVTESILSDNQDKIIGVLHQIRSRNIKIALDDFGTGFSSLSYLKVLPIDYLKIDKSFINELATSGDSRLLLAILAIAKTMGLSSIVEGVETREQVDFLRSAGCDIIQGYYINRALVIDEVIKLYKNNGEYL